MHTYIFSTQYRAASGLKLHIQNMLCLALYQYLKMKIMKQPLRFFRKLLERYYHAIIDELPTKVKTRNGLSKGTAIRKNTCKSKNEKRGDTYEQES